MVHIHKTLRCPLPMNEKECLLNNLHSLADAIVAMFGPHCEACVHDLTRLHSSLVYIRGEVTHRSPGAPATDLLVKMVNNQQHLGNVHSYRTVAADGRTLKSTTTLVRDGSGQAVAALCINFDTTELAIAAQALQPFLAPEQAPATPPAETFAHSTGETVEALFHQAARHIGKHPQTMSRVEKAHLVALLEADGLFHFKGAVEQVAKLLGVTRYTVYNHLKKARKNNAHNHEEHA